MILSFLLIAFSFFSMELVANFSHRFLMHGSMWHFHQDHHRGSPGIFEKNDIFFVIFALPSIILINTGFWTQDFIFMSLGIGILLYGIAYFLVHEVLIHRRLKFLDNLKNPYFDALKKAHRDHHRIIEKEGCSNFGMLWVPLKYYKK
jgi:beta-carotene 3-hydroxylase